MKCAPAFKIDKLNSVGASEPSDGPAGETARAVLAKVSVMVDIVNTNRAALSGLRTIDNNRRRAFQSCRNAGRP